MLIHTNYNANIHYPWKDLALLSSILHPVTAFLPNELGQRLKMSKQERSCRNSYPSFSLFTSRVILKSNLRTSSCLELLKQFCHNSFMKHIFGWFLYVRQHCASRQLYKGFGGVVLRLQCSSVYILIQAFIRSGNQCPIVYRQPVGFGSWIASPLTV